MSAGIEPGGIILVDVPPEWWDDSVGDWVMPPKILQATRRMARRRGLSDAEAYSTVEGVIDTQELPDDEEECDALLDLAYYRSEEEAGRWFSSLAERKRYSDEDAPPLF